MAIECTHGKLATCNNKVITPRFIQQVQICDKARYLVTDSCHGTSNSGDAEHDNGENEADDLNYRHPVREERTAHTQQQWHLVNQNDTITSI